LNEVLDLGFRHGRGHEKIEEAHEDTAEDGEDQPAENPTLFLAGQFP